MMPQETEECHLGAALPPSCHRDLAFSLSRQEQFCFGLTLPEGICLRCHWEVALWLKLKDAWRPPAWLMSQSSAGTGGDGDRAYVYDTPAVCQALRHTLYVYIHFQFALIHGPDIPGPMQYCSSLHRALLLLPVTSTTGYCFCFGSIPVSGTLTSSHPLLPSSCVHLSILTRSYCTAQRKSVQYPMVSHNGKEYLGKNVYTYIAVSFLYRRY